VWKAGFGLREIGREFGRFLAAAAVELASRRCSGVTPAKRIRGFRHDVRVAMQRFPLVTFGHLEFLR
jgi:hypothetical protein